MSTFREVLPNSAIENGHVVLYKAWLKSLMTQPTEKGEVSVFDLNTDKDRYGLTESAAIALAFNNYGMGNIFNSFVSNLWNLDTSAEHKSDGGYTMTQYKNGEEKNNPSNLKLSSTSEEFLNENVLTIAKITLISDDTDEQIVLAPEGADDITPETLDPFYDKDAGLICATIRGRISNMQVTHNKILNLTLDKDPSENIRVTEIKIEEIPLN